MSDTSGNRYLQDIVARSLDGALGLLARRVTEPDFAGAVRTAFGDDADRKVIADYLADVLLGKGAPSIKIVSGDTLNGAHGAYDAKSDTIFISAEYVAQHAAAPAPIQRVLLEELGHAIDAKLNAVRGTADAPGDEGAIFASLVTGERLTAAELAAMKSEDDHATIQIDGQAAQVEMAASYGTVTLDGALSDWTAADRLDSAASGAAGYALYGKLTGGAYVFAISSATVIAGETTVWLNTDQNSATGYKIWGWAGGAEYNINFDSAGLPKLFTGASGQTLANGTIDHTFSADRKTVEFAVPVAMLAGAPQAVDVLADVNEQVYLPNDYSAYTYTVAAAATGPAPVVGDVTLNGDLSDWTAAQRLEVPGSGVAGYEVYGKYVGDSYVFALKSTTGEIGAGTTIWLNTDQNKATGHQIWGFAGGAEYNVNFTTKPNLYTGDEGQTLVNNALAYAYSADKGIVEFAVSAALLAGAPKAVDVLIDVNNQVYLPIDYSSYTYTVAAPTAPGPAPVVGGMTLDGSLAEWTGAERIDLPGFQIPGYEIYGKLAGDHYIVAIKSDTAIGAGTTTWFNVDQNAATGYQIFGNSGGAEYNVNIGANKSVGLYTGDAGQTLVQSALQSGFSADGKVVEFAVAKSAMVGATGNVNVLADVNDQTYLPVDYANQFTIRSGVTPPPPTGSADLKVAIVYSATTAAKYFDLTAYSQLFMSAQHQATMGGVPFDVLSEADLTDAAKLASYDAIIFPSFSHVPDGKLGAIETALNSAVYDHGVSLITAGDFMTNDAAGNSLPGDSYARMKTLLGVTFGGFGTGDVSVHAGDTTHPMMDGYQANELIRDYTNTGYLHFAPVSSATVLANQQVAGQTYNAVLATQTGGDNVHFATDALLADNNMLWQAIQQVTKPAGGIELGLQMSRQTSIVAARNDMDQSQETADVSPDSGPGIYDAMLSIVQQWKADYNFVGSYYINVGNNPPDQMTNWSVSKPYYQQLLAMGNEIGTHSYTHPEDTNLLNAAQIEFQFNQSQLVIEQQLGIDVVGAALPGNPEKIATATQVIQYFDYISGGASTFGAGYPGAFGYLTPALADKVYLAPNVSFDFTLAGWLNMTPEQAEAAWAKEWGALTSHAEVPVIVWPWHDYGPTEWMIDPPAGSLYTTEMYTNFIARAAASGAEFVTLADLAQRIESFEKANVSYTTAGNVVTASITGADLGKFALDIDGGQKIQKVNGWYAYDDDSVFTDRDGGQFEITLGATADDVTHIVALPSRAELLSVTGDGTNLSFSAIGDGKVVIDLKNPGSQQVTVQGAVVVSLVGERLELNLVGMGQHDVTVTLGTAPPPTGDHAPVITSNGGTDSAAISIAENALAVTTVKATDQDGGALRYVIASGADQDDFTINETTGALSFKTAPDFETPADAGGNNVYDIVVQAIDGGGLFDQQTLAIRVTDVGGLTLNGTGSANTLTGAGESDTLDGKGGNDTLSGLVGNDILIGGAGADTLLGGAGIDTMRGDGGNDRLTGGAGADIMTGGAGRDTFIYGAMEDFGSLTARDLIKDFVSTQDRLDLSALDANAGVSGNQAFQFLSTQGAAFTAAGQVRFVHDAGANKTYVEGNIDAALGADFRIELDTLVPLKPADVVL